MCLCIYACACKGCMSMRVCRGMCVCVRACACVRACKRVCTRARMHDVNVSIKLPTCQPGMHPSLAIEIRVCGHAHELTYALCMCMCLSMCICACMHACVCTQCDSILQHDMCTCSETKGPHGIVTAKTAWKKHVKYCNCQIQCQ